MRKNAERKGTESFIQSQANIPEFTQNKAKQLDFHVVFITSAGILAT